MAIARMTTAPMAAATIGTPNARAPIGLRGSRRPRSGLPLSRRIPIDLATAIALTCLSALASVAAEPEAAAEIVAAQIRTQGYACSQPVSAVRDRAASRPNEAVWVLSCGNARYRVQLVPDMAAQVTRLE